MKKTYEPETKSAIEQVIDVFNDYIRTSTHFELLWSDKVGYIYISIFFTTSFTQMDVVSMTMK